jgi:hypothetical protein
MLGRLLLPKERDALTEIEHLQKKTNDSWFSSFYFNHEKRCASASFELYGDNGEVAVSRTWSGNPFADMLNPVWDDSRYGYRSVVISQ